MSHYYDLRFERSLDKALEAARLALKSAKCVKLTDEAHAYGDKFAAAEVAVRLATSSSLAFAELLLGLDAAKASQIRDAKGDGKLQLVCDFGGTTTYLKEREREVVWLRLRTVLASVAARIRAVHELLRARQAVALTRVCTVVRFA